jgi:TonB family protein
VAPYIAGPARPRRSSLGWAWLTIVVTLLLAVGSYWFYEGFDGDLEKVRERLEAFTHRLVPEDRMAAVPEAAPGLESAMAPGLDPKAPLPVVSETESRPETLDRPDSVTGQRVEPSNEPQPPAVTAEETGPPGVALDGTRQDGGAVPLTEPNVPAGPLLPTRRGLAVPTRREPPSAAADDSGWYRTDPSLSMDNAPQDVLAANAPDATPRPLVRATPQPRMTPFASGVLAPGDDVVEARRPTQIKERPTAPAVALPTELSTYREKLTPTPTPTPKPTPIRPSDAGMAQMSVGRVTAGVQLVDLGLVYASRALTGIQKNFSPPFRKGGATARVSFLIRESGEIDGIALEKSSGSDGLDGAALKAVSKTGPLEPLPSEVGGDAVRVEVQFEF